MRNPTISIAKYFSKSFPKQTHQNVNPFQTKPINYRRLPKPFVPFVEYFPNPNPTRLNAESFPKQTLANAEFVLPKPSMSKCRILSKTSMSICQLRHISQTQHVKPQEPFHSKPTPSICRILPKWINHGLWVQFCKIFPKPKLAQ
jgi:hypothetical protein